jgi:ABC-type proline/glycine betaine transport system substrate-binding protein
MKKIKLLFAILAAVAGTSGAIASNLPAPSADIKYNWLNWDDELVLVNQTQAQAQLLCSGSQPTVCLRAQGATYIYTTGELSAFIK